MICTGCKKSLRPHERFCSDCGIRTAVRVPHQHGNVLQPKPRYALIISVCLILVLLAAFFLWFMGQVTNFPGEDLEIFRQTYISEESHPAMPDSDVVP